MLTSGHPLWPLKVTVQAIVPDPDLSKVDFGRRTRNMSFMAVVTGERQSLSCGVVRSIYGRLLSQRHFSNLY